MTERVYLDWNATAPLRPEAGAALLAACDVAGNPSSVHAEGRAARGLVERARGQIAAALGAKPQEVIFTSGATEAASVLAHFAAVEVEPTAHDALWTHHRPGPGAVWAQGLANSETGIVTDLPEMASDHGDDSTHGRGDGDGHASGNGRRRGVGADSDTGPGPAVAAEGAAVTALHGGAAPGRGRHARGRPVAPARPLRLLDATQAVGRIPFAFSWSGADLAVISGHKFGAPKGVGALLVREGLEIPPLALGGGQELSRRAGTENILGIAAMAAALTAALAELEAGVWDRVARRRDALEARLLAEVPGLTVVGLDARRLPNTSCLVLPGWKGETQVMQMDLSGFAVSAGSACSSGKVKPSRVLKAMGHDDRAAASALRVSLGPQTTEAQLDRFAATWIAAARRHRARAA